MSAIHAPMFSGEYDPYWNDVISLWVMVSLEDYVQPANWVLRDDAYLSGGELFLPGLAGPTYTHITDGAKLDITPDSITLSVDYCIEFYATFDSVTETVIINNQGAIFLFNSGDTPGAPGIGYNTDSSGNAGNYILRIGVTSYPSSTPISVGRHHLAITRHDSTVRLFVDGIEIVSATNSDTPSLSIWFFGFMGYYGYNIFPSKRSDFRFTNGAARYTENFTPPTVPFPNS